VPDRCVSFLLPGQPHPSVVPCVRCGQPTVYAGEIEWRYVCPDLRHPTRQFTLWPGRAL
jgi:hypothetical protein